MVPVDETAQTSLSHQHEQIKLAWSSSSMLRRLWKPFRAQSTAFGVRASSSLEYLHAVRQSVPFEMERIHDMITKYEQMVCSFEPDHHKVVSSHEVFVNNQLRLSQIDVVGFDYDYTLCHYNDNLQHLIYAMAREYLVHRLRYPSGLEALEFDPSFAIRGLTIDKEKGLLCKVSSHQKLSHTGVYRGRQRLERSEIHKLYGGSRHISVAYRDSKMDPLNDLFSVAHACLFADVVQYLIDRNIEYEPVAIVEDVATAVAQVHSSGRMHRTVAKDLQHYLEPNPLILPLLERIKASGKKLFLCTNSTFPYIDAGLKYMLGKNWRKLFNLVVVSARKPRFYTRQRAFRMLDIHNKQVKWQAVKHLTEDNVYTHGSLSQLNAMTGWPSSRVLYIGDSIFSDLVEPSRASGWRTGAIIRELEDEIRVQRTPEYQKLSFQVTALEDLIRQVQIELRPATGTKIQDHHLMARLVDAHEKLQLQMESLINKHFGSVFRADNYPSQFAFSVQRYVDFYSARLDNLLEYPDNHTFYPERLFLPHERQQPHRWFV